MPDQNQSLTQHECVLLPAHGRTTGFWCATTVGVHLEGPGPQGTGDAHVSSATTTASRLRPALSSSLLAWRLNGWPASWLCCRLVVTPILESGDCAKFVRRSPLEWCGDRARVRQRAVGVVVHPQRDIRSDGRDEISRSARGRASMRTAWSAPLSNPT